MTQALLNIKQVAQILNVSPQTVRRLKGELQAKRIGRQLRFDPEAVQRYLEDSKIRDDESSNAIPEKVYHNIQSNTIRRNNENDK